MTDPAATPALLLPALAVACPRCGSQPHTLCTSRVGARVRRHDVHRDRTAAHARTTAS